MYPNKWTCPFCNHDTTITKQDISDGSTGLNITNKHGVKIMYSTFIVCPNPECMEYSLEIELYNARYVSSYGNYIKENLIKKWCLVPSSQAKVYPDYIPKAIRTDYEEACLIKDLSSKASATLARRCLQGIIRDFWDVTKSRLIDEIEAIKEKVDPFTWDAIDAVRKIGNIGAHMEKDINIIVDVEPNEAELLIQLLETLIQDWYISRHERQVRLQKIVRLKDEKEIIRKNKQ